MKICPNCGYRETVPWIGSRFDFNAEYIKFEEAPNYKQIQLLAQQLQNRGNFDRIVIGPYSYYRRGTNGIYLYRVPNEDFKVHRERKNHFKKVEEQKTK
jgi:hypothetical protein